MESVSALTPVGRKALTFDSLKIETSATPQVGDTVNVKVKFTSFTSGNARISMLFPGHVGPVNRLTGETERDTLVYVDSGFSYTYNLPMKLFQYGGSFIQATIVADVFDSSRLNFSTK